MIVTDEGVSEFWGIPKPGLPELAKVPGHLKCNHEEMDVVFKYILSDWHFASTQDSIGKSVDQD